MERKLRDIYIEVHTFKAEAGSLNLTSVVSLAHELETSIQTVLAQPIVAGTDLFAAIVLLEKLIYYIEGMQNLTEKVARLASEAEPVAVPRPKRTNRWQHLHTLAQVLAARQGKNWCCI